MNSASANMDVNLLIDAIVRQTTILIAQLATASGGRATLAGTANQVFLNLVNELKQQGLSNKVIADMFGLALRTYHNRVQRLRESNTFAGRSVWEAVLEHVESEGPVTRAQVLLQFVRDEPAQVRAVLNDLVGSQLLVKTGRGDATTYRLATGKDRARESDAELLERVTNLIWVAVHRFGPVSHDQLNEIVPAGGSVLERALGQLLVDGRVTRNEEHPPTYRAESYCIPIGTSAGWEAAVFDHYQAMVTALCRKLRDGQRLSHSADWVGGSTYAYDVWSEHPLHGEVSGFLEETRRRAVSLRERVEQHNQQHSPPPGAVLQRFSAYVGQSYTGEEESQSGDEE